MVEILKASAGSGKTWNLARTYLELLFDPGSDAGDRAPYRHILAVTFTNKATDEMKSRILEELNTLAVDPARSAYTEILAGRFFGGDAGKLQDRARELLFRLLHDYGAFSVSTIDKFFQQALKAFARELGRMSNYQVELDKKSLVEEAVDRILDGLDADNPAQRELLDWLKECALENLQGGKSHWLDGQLKDMANNLLSDRYRELAERWGDETGRSTDPSVIYAKARLKKLRTACRKVLEDEVRRFRSAAADIRRVVGEAGLQYADFKGGAKGYMNVVAKAESLRPGDELPVPSPAFHRAAQDSGEWFSKPNASLLPRVQGRLEGPLQALSALALDEAAQVLYRTASLISAQLFSLGVAGEFFREFHALLGEKNVLDIDDSNTMLRSIIGDTDTPFVYEKLGVRYEHFLLDEFQDTSTIQWENFRPLLRESLASGRRNLIVGDVKQSIYRWRGSDWNLLHAQVGRDLAPSAERSLERNFRTLREIVEFNNAFFTFAARALDWQIGGHGENRIQAIYGDVVQQVACRDDAPGRVHLSFCDGKVRTQEDLVVQSVEDALSRGAAYRDIAVLVRKNDVGSAMASCLLAAGIPVISDDSLSVKASLTVRRLVSLLSYAGNPADRVGAFLAESLGIRPEAGYHSLTDLAESLLRALRELDGERVDKEVLYVQSFMDDLQAWTAANGNLLGEFLRHWAEADPKLASPASVDAVRIITIHKAKGLEYPYVIFPHAEKVELFRSEDLWSRAQIPDGSPLQDADGLYHVKLSAKSEGTAFAQAYREESFLQHVDNLNVLYVAMTRPRKELHILSDLPEEAFRSDAEAQIRATETLPREGEAAPCPRVSKPYQLLWYFSRAREGGDIDPAGEEFSFGTPYDFSLLRKAPGAESVTAAYPSWPLGERLRFSTDSRDFFAPEQAQSAQARLRGVVLHEILSRVHVPSELETSLQQSVAAGALDGEEAVQARALLARRIESGRARGWFPDDPAAVCNETALLTPEGENFRPDRVVFGPGEGEVTVVDYKFGRHNPAYAVQVRRYMDLYRRMGYAKVRGRLWYVFTDEVEEVEP